MTLLVVFSLAAGLGLLTARPLGRWAAATLTPARAVIVVTAVAVAAALAAGLALTSIAIAYLARWQPIAREGDISVAVLRRLAPVPAWLGLAAAVTLAVLLGRVAAALVVIGSGLLRAHRLTSALPGADPVVFVDDTDVYTVPGVSGRIVVGTRLYDQLSAEDRQVVMAHEHSHLHNRHHLYIHAVDLAAAANPVLTDLRAMVRLGVERWADEDAGAAVGNRGLAAKALARTALIRAALRRDAQAPTPAGALAAATLHVTTRVQALLAPPNPGRTIRTVSLAVIAATLLVAGVANVAHLNELIEAARVHLGRP